MVALNNTTTLTGIGIEPTTITVSYNEVISLFGNQIMTIVLLGGLLLTIQSILFFFPNNRFCRESNEYISDIGLFIGLYLFALGLIWKFGWNI